MSKEKLFNNSGLYKLIGQLQKSGNGHIIRGIRHLVNSPSKWSKQRVGLAPISPEDATDIINAVKTQGYKKVPSPETIVTK